MSGYSTFEAHSSYISPCSRRQSRTSPIWGESRAILKLSGETLKFLFADYTSPIVRVGQQALVRSFGTRYKMLRLWSRKCTFRIFVLRSSCDAADPAAALNDPQRGASLRAQWNIDRAVWNVTQSRHTGLLQ